ncbi:MAG: YraN family protein [Chloroflexota bacterium]|nr:YraN family protein [Chloroflexota bacterium]
MTHPARSLGARGESLARQFLVNLGYEIIASNWSTRYGEIDIIARFDGLIVFVEVKTRQGRDTQSAFAGISRAKHERLVKAAYQYLHEHELDEAHWRMDAIGIALQRRGGPVIDHIEDAFDW